LLLVGCGQENITQSKEIDWASFSFPASTFQRDIPDSYKGKGEVISLLTEQYASSSTVELSPITLHCSDGMDRQSYALSDAPIYLSEEKEGSKTANGACSTSGNITLLSQIGLLNGNSLEEILDGLVERQASTASPDSTFFVSNTVQTQPQMFLTQTIYTEGDSCLETFYVFELLDEQTVQLYILSRLYESSDLTEDEMAEMDQDALVRWCFSSDENRDVYCGILQALLSSAKEGD